jgi:RecA-family ATPase
MTTHESFELDWHEAEDHTDAERQATAEPAEDVKESPTPDDFELVCLADVKPEPIVWIWPGRVPLGKLTIIAGDGGLGKSTLTLDMAATVSAGYCWPDAPEVPAEAGSVIVLSAEDGLADTIRPRLDAAGADVSKVHALTTVRQRDGSMAPFNLKRDVPKLEKVLKKVGDVRLVIIDPVSAFTGDADDHKNGVVRGLLAPLAELAERFKVAVVLVSHLNKNMGGKAAHRLLGSVAFFAAARAVWLVVADPEDPERRLMLRSKSNLAASMTGLAFRIVKGAIRWESAPVHLLADDVLAAEGEAPDRDTEVNRAMTFLRDTLAGGPMASHEIMSRADGEGISESTLRRAKKQAGILAGRAGFGRGSVCHWKLPPESSTGPAQAGPPPLGKYGNNGARRAEQEEDRWSA